MKKNVILGCLCVSLHLCAFEEPLVDIERVDIRSLPTPYCTVHLMPFNPHGYYGNAAPMEHLIKKYRVNTIIEVGSWMGLSTRHMARLVPKDGMVYAIDTWQGTPTTLLEHHHPKEVLATLYDQFLSNVIHTGLTHKIFPIRMDSQSAAKIVQINPDLIYIDATHEYEYVLQDLEAWFPFVQGHGILCGDDWDWGENQRPIQAAVKKFAAKNHLDIEVYQGLWVLVEKTHTP